MIVDNRARWFEETAALRARDPGGFLCRYEAGRRVQASIQKQDLTLARLQSLGTVAPLPSSLPAGVASLDGRRNRKRA